MAGGNIKVVVRVRPFNGREVDRRAKCVVKMDGNQTILVPPPEAEERMRKGGKGTDGQKSFAFDRSYWSFDRNDKNFAGQDSLYRDLGTPLLDNAFQGYNNCIFAYGQTGSGKSYSMMGYGEEAGVIPKICQNMFQRITELQKDKNLTCTVEVSYLEIYNERVRDLLNPATKGNLKVREHPSTGPYVEDLAKLAVRSFQEIEHLMDEGNKARTVAATSMNETSSRSHAVFTLTVTQKRHDVETRMDTEKVAKISLVDLAGSERATSTGAIGARLKEGAEINRSLSTLGRVIAALADLSMGKKKNMSMVPYRDSVLTWLLKDSLGGNSMTAMIAAISPADINFEETLSTLRYADSAKRIKNHAVVNEDPNARMIRELKEELAQLRSKLGSGATSGGIAEEQYAPDTPLDQQIVSITQADGTIKRVSKADIAEQLNQSEKLYEDLNQTWEEKLEKTEQIHREREAALEELGISIEKGFVGVSTPKRIPHLVNLSDDPLLAECLVYNIKPGTTAVGNVEDPGTTSEIRLNGSKIMKDHCTFENVDGYVTLVPRDGAAIMVNGLRMDKPTRLRSGNRVILGDFHIFRFNHPQEARAERKEQSLLRHSVTASQLGSPVPRPSHSRSESRIDVESDIDGSIPESPMPSRSGRDSDWSYARREAAGAILGADQKITHLTDDELDALFDDVQRARAVRKGRPESRLFGPEDEDSESVSSYPSREKCISNGTLDNFSLDTALTLPSTPQQNGIELAESDDGRLELIRDDMRSQLEKQKEDFEEKLRVAETSSTQNVEELRAEKERMEHALETAKENYKRQLEQQKETFARELQGASNSPLPKRPRITQDGFTELPEEEKAIVRVSLARWWQVGHVRLAEAILRHAANLKEAQIMSQVMDKNVVFQFTIVGEGQDVCSSYDLVLSGIPGDEDPALEAAVKPCVAVRVIDYQNTVIHLWSLEKLEQRVRTMRQMHQYLDRPDYLQHFRLENPFIETCLPQFSLIGEADVPLTAVFEARVQDYTIELYSTFTLEAIGRLKLSLEPSAAQAPPKMLKFNVVMHEMLGFAEREGTELHGQMFIPGISEEGGATTTQMIQDFDEDPIRFESVHSMSIPRSAPRSATLRVAIFAKVTPMHLDRLLSWDEIQETGEDVSLSGHDQTARLPESEYWMQEEHDVYAKIKILELSETGEYLPVEIDQHSNLDSGFYQLHQGLQRRIMISLTCSSSESLQWMEVKSLRVGSLHLIDQDSSILGRSDSSRQLPLELIKEPAVVDDANGIKEFTLTAQWDSSLHGSSLLDRPTADRHSVQMSISVDITSSRVHQPMTFTLEENLQIRPRWWLRPQSMFKQLWKTTRIIHYTSGIFSVSIKPASAKRASDIWRMDSQETYVKGEEDLNNWKPRGVGLLRDYILSQQIRRRIADVEATKVFLRRQRSPLPTPASFTELTPAQKSLIQKCLDLWTLISSKPPSLTLSSAGTSGSSASIQSQPQPKLDPPPLTAAIHRHPKNPVLLKSSFLLTPNPTSHVWTRHFAELRPPYLHLYAVPSGNETATINLRNARIDVDPPVQRLLNEKEGLRGRQGRKNVWAVYARGGSWLFAARSEEEKGRWVLAIDEGFIDDP
ncbi:MAG: kinesin-like protein Klp8 [Alectoria sarmentosa]|nr:MAG: kinesin-like protein Klp8 [Alectoria sarmentosa]